MNAEMLDRLKRAADVITSLRATALAMCDDMDKSNDIAQKEAIKIAIIETESLLDSAIDAYNELIKQASEDERNR